MASSRHRQKRKTLFIHFKIVPTQCLQHSFLLSFERGKCFLKINFFFLLKFCKKEPCFGNNNKNCNKFKIINFARLQSKNNLFTLKHIFTKIILNLNGIIFSLFYSMLSHDMQRKECLFETKS